jgi:hypothetical protein
MEAHTHSLRRLLAMGAALAAVACGSETPHVQQASASPLTGPSVGFKQTGDAQVSIDQSSVRYRLDDAGLLQITLRLTSNAATAQSVGVLGFLYDRSGRLVDDASGSDINVQPHSTVQLTLSGPRPSSLPIATATFEVRLTPASTP